MTSRCVYERAERRVERRCDRGPGSVTPVTGTAYGISTFAKEEIFMRLLSYGLAIALGYLLGRPGGRESLGQVGRQAVELGKRPEVARLRERGKSVAVAQVRAVKEKVSPTHFPASDGAAPPASLGGTTVMEDSEAAVLGRPVTPPPPTSATSGS
jgi:hypothetical protein